MACIVLAERQACYNAQPPPSPPVLTLLLPLESELATALCSDPSAEAAPDPCGGWAVIRPAGLAADTPAPRQTVRQRLADRPLVRAAYELGVVLIVVGSIVCSLTYASFQAIDHQLHLEQPLADTADYIGMYDGRLDAL